MELFEALHVALQGEFPVCSSKKVTLSHEFAGTVVSCGEAAAR